MDVHILANRAAVITGGAGGVGFAIAQAFAKAGARLLLVGRTQAPLRTACSALQNAGATAHFVALDVTLPDAAERLVQAAEAHLGGFDLLVNAAGDYVYKDLLSLTPEDWQRAIDTNLSAPYRLSQAFAARCIAKGQAGSILHIGSVHGAIGDAFAIPQCASKAGLVGLNRALAEALRPHNIRVNTIAPGAIAPASHDIVNHTVQARISQGDVAQMALYLVSDQASSVTGACLDLFGSSRPVLTTRRET